MAGLDWSVLRRGGTPVRLQARGPEGGSLPLTLLPPETRQQRLVPCHRALGERKSPEPACLLRKVWKQGLSGGLHQLPCRGAAQGQFVKYQLFSSSPLTL